MPDMIDPAVPQAVINAAIVAAMRDEAYDARWAKISAEDAELFGYADDYVYCDMTPVVREARRIDEPGYTGPDRWTVAVQYSRKGCWALYGVNANHVPTLYQD
jgi:hypothetical protein